MPLKNIEECKQRIIARFKRFIKDDQLPKYFWINKLEIPVFEDLLKIDAFNFIDEKDWNFDIERQQNNYKILLISKKETSPIRHAFLPLTFEKVTAFNCYENITFTDNFGPFQAGEKLDFMEIALNADNDTDPYVWCFSSEKEHFYLPVQIGKVTVKT